MKSIHSFNKKNDIDSMNKLLDIVIKITEDWKEFKAKEIYDLDDPEDLASQVEGFNIKYGLEIRPDLYKSVVRLPRFSYYKAPVTNTIPNGELNILKVGLLIILPDFYGPLTEKLRSMDKDEYTSSKARKLDYITCSGVFEKRGNQWLLSHSGYICLDIDHIKDPEELKVRLANDEKLMPELIFISPGGNGIKCIVSIDIKAAPHDEYFSALSSYLDLNYGVEIDSACKDVSRACFLCHDPNCFINPKYLQLC